MRSIAAITLVILLAGSCGPVAEDAPVADEALSRTGWSRNPDLVFRVKDGAPEIAAFYAYDGPQASLIIELRSSLDPTSVLQRLFVPGDLDEHVDRATWRDFARRHALDTQDVNTDGHADLVGPTTGHGDESELIYWVFEPNRGRFNADARRMANPVDPREAAAL